MWGEEPSTVFLHCGWFFISSSIRASSTYDNAVLTSSYEFVKKIIDFLASQSIQ